jgi:hypothetical protein
MQAKSVIKRDHAIVLKQAAPRPLADSVRAEAFPQSDDLRAQSFAAKFTLETDHLVTRGTRAKAREPLLVTLADLLLRYRRRCSLRRGIALRVLRPDIGRRARLISLGTLSNFTITQQHAAATNAAHRIISAQRLWTF